jgi:hypothetical protein
VRSRQRFLRSDSNSLPPSRSLSRAHTLSLSGSRLHLIIALADDVRIASISAIAPATLPLTFDFILDGALAAFPLDLGIHESPLTGGNSSAPPASLWETLCKRSNTSTKEAPSQILFEEASALDGYPVTVPGQDTCRHVQQLKLEELPRGTPSNLDLRLTEAELLPRRAPAFGSAMIRRSQSVSAHDAQDAPVPRKAARGAAPILRTSSWHAEESDDGIHSKDGSRKSTPSRDRAWPSAAAAPSASADKEPDGSGLFGNDSRAVESLPVNYAERKVKWLHQESMKTSIRALRTDAGLARYAHSFRAAQKQRVPAPEYFSSFTQFSSEMVFSIIHMQKLARGFLARKRMSKMRAEMELLRGQYSEEEAQKIVRLQKWARKNHSGSIAVVNFQTRMKRVMRATALINQSAHIQNAALLKSLSIAVSVAVEGCEPRAADDGSHGAHRKAKHPLTALEDKMKLVIPSAACDLPLVVTVDGIEPSDPETQLAALRAALPHCSSVWRTEVARQKLRDKGGEIAKDEARLVDKCAQEYRARGLAYRDAAYLALAWTDVYMEEPRDESGGKVSYPKSYYEVHEWDLTSEAHRAILRNVLVAQIRLGSLSDSSIQPLCNAYLLPASASTAITITQGSRTDMSLADVLDKTGVIPEVFHFFSNSFVFVVRSTSRLT